MNSISASLGAHARTITATRPHIFRRAWLWTGCLAFATIASGPQPAPAAVTEAWVQRYGSDAGTEDRAFRVVTDAAGNVIVAGTTALIKYSGAGVPLWTNHPNGDALVAVDTTGNVFVTESSTIKKYSGAGAPLWTNQNNGGTTAMAVDASGNVLVTGSFSSFASGSYDYVTTKYSGAGVPLWTNRYNGPAGSQDFAKTLAVDASGNVFVTGVSDSHPIGYGLGPNYDYATVAYSAAGVRLWAKRYNGPGNGYDDPNAVAVDGSGNVFVTGYSEGSGGQHGYATLGYSSAGVPLWTNRYDGAANAIAVDASGNVFVTGNSWNGGDSDYATIAYSGAGVALWTNRYNGPANRDDYAGAVVVDGSGNVFVTGGSYGSGGDSDYATIAYSGAGVALWTNRYNGPGNGSDGSSAVAVDGSGNVFVTGSSPGSGGDFDYATIAYSGAGAALWTNRYNAGRVEASDTAMAVAVDASGNVFVTGYSASVGSGADATIAYSGAGVPLWTNSAGGTAIVMDGQGNVFVAGTSETIAYSSVGVPLWTNLYNNGYSARGTAVAVDGSGNVFLTAGNSIGDYATIAYSGAGVPLWTNNYSVSGYLTDQATDVAVDGGGNVFVTGSSVGDYVTIAYSAAGVALWTNRYNGPGNGHDGASAVAVDGSGNVVVTGSSAGGGCYSDYDYVTIAYSGAGVPLWTNRYNGPGNGFDSPLTKSSLAIGSDGAVYVTGASDGLSSDFATLKYVWQTEIAIQLMSTIPPTVNLTVSGAPNSSWAIERARELTGPWTNLSALLIGTSGSAQFQDTNPPSAAGFYRARQ